MAFHAGKSLFWHSFHLNISANFVIFQPYYKIYFIRITERRQREREKEEHQEEQHSHLIIFK